MEYVRELDTRAAGTAATQSALKVHRLTFMEAAMLVVGSTIGSGVLGLAYASRLAGWPVPFVWLVVAGIFSGISMLYVAETALRTQEPLQLSGLAEKYVGRIGSWLIFFSVGATSFCSLIAYTAGCGRILSECTGLTPELAGILFAAAATVVVWGGLKVTGVAEKFLSLGMIIMLLLLSYQPACLWQIFFIPTGPMPSRFLILPFSVMPFNILCRSWLAALPMRHKNWCRPS